MKIHYYIFISAISLLLSYSDIDDRISNSLNDFGFNLLKEINHSNIDNNVVYSPYSISYALLMASEGGANSSKQEILDILGLEDIHPFILHDFILKHSSNDSSNTSLINGDWIQADVCYEPNKRFIKIMESIYRSKVSFVDFTKMRESIILDINNWVLEQTNSLISDMISDEDVKLNTVQIIINALYFYEQWSEPFDSLKTVDGQFYSSPKDSSNVSMLSNTSYYRHLDNNLLHLLDIPYKDGKTSFLVLLPHENNIDSVLNHLDAKTLKEYLADAKYEKGDIKIPKFSLESSYSMKDYLINMGLLSPFSPRLADFSGFWDYANYCKENPPRHYIDIIKHKSAFKIDQLGTEATSATSVIINRVTMVDPKLQPFSFIANRPFIFMIYNKEINTILFVGIFRSPD